MTTFTGFTTQRARGVALLTVLLVTFLASVSVVRLAALQQGAIHRSGLLEQQRQARWYLLGAEQWARGLLARDRQDGAVDHQGEPWAQLPPALTLPAGSIGGRLTDLQGRLNVNNLVADDAALAERTLARLTRLLELLDIDPGLAQAIADWVDDDTRRRFPDGAEDGDYLIRPVPHLSANRPLTSPTELRLLGALDDDSYRRLRPLLAALPAGTAINVNTAAPEVLAALFANQDVERMTRLSERRERQFFRSPGEFLAAVGLPQTASADAAASGDLSVGSQFFSLRADARFGDARARLTSLLRRDGDDVRVLLRSYGDEL